MPSIDVVSWDVDGTLYDAGRMKRFVVRAALARAFRRQTWRELRQLGRFRAAVDAARSEGEAAASLRGRAELLPIERRWYGPAIGRAGLREGVAEALAEVARAGVPQVIISDFIAGYKLDALGIAGAFAQVFSGESLGHFKPSPALFLAVCERLGIAPGRLLHVGDREDRDGAAARAAGCQVVILGRTFPSLDPWLR